MKLEMFKAQVVNNASDDVFYANTRNMGLVRLWKVGDDDMFVDYIHRTSTWVQAEGFAELVKQIKAAKTQKQAGYAGEGWTWLEPAIQVQLEEINSEEVRLQKELYCLEIRKSSWQDRLFWGYNMPRCNKSREKYFVWLEKLRREIRGKKGTTLANKGENRNIDGGINATIITPSGKTCEGKIYVNKDITLIAQAEYGVAAYLINTADIPSNRTINLKDVSFLRIVHAGRNIQFIESIKTSK